MYMLLCYISDVIILNLLNVNHIDKYSAFDFQKHLQAGYFNELVQERCNSIGVKSFLH